MCALHGEERALDDGLRGLVDVPQSGDLWKEVFKVATDTGVLVRPDERDVCAASVESSGVGSFELGDDRTRSDTRL